MRALNFRSVGPTVQPAERKQTDRRTDPHTDATEYITSSANAGGKNLNTKKVVRIGAFLSSSHNITKVLVKPV